MINYGKNPLYIGWWSLLSGCGIHDSRFEGEHVLVYRLGGLTLEDIRKIVPHAQLQLSSSSDPKAPGMLLSHYAPRKKLLYGDLEHLMNHYSGKRVAVISFSKDYGRYSGVVSNEICLRKGNLTAPAAARSLPPCAS